MIYLSSDWHFSHFNIISYCNRPFKDLEEMNEGIINICNNTVTAEDSLYLLGDISLNPKYIELFIPRLNCKNLYLIQGNHDQCYPRADGKKLQKSNNAREKYLNSGFKCIEFSMKLKLGKYEVELCHFPFAPKKEVMGEDLRYLSARPEDKGQILCHGHLHSKYRKRGNMIDCGIDGDWKIFSEDDIIALIEDPRDFIETPISEHYRKRKENE